jgi:hypothetical protein
VFFIFELFVVAVQDLDMEFVGVSQCVKNSRDNHFIIVFTDAEAVFAITEVGIDPAEVGSVERVDGNGFENEIEFVAADDVGFGAGAIVSRWPVSCAILFDFL